MAFIEMEPIRSKIVMNNKIIEQVSHFNYLGCDTILRIWQGHAVGKKLVRYGHICMAIHRHLKTKQGKKK